MTVNEVMTKRVVTCLPETNLAEATALMWENGCGVLPVLGAGGEVVGVVTDRDICIALGTRNVRASDLSVRDVVHDHTLVCNPDDEIHTALKMMREGKIRRLPVVTENSRLEGIVSLDDVVLKAGNGDGAAHSEISYTEVVTTMQAIYAHGDPLRAQAAVV